MLSLELLVFCISSISLLQSVHASPAHDHETHSHFHRNFHRRNYVTPAQRSSSYDYVIVGGGLAGLALASTLSDDSSKTVLVLEAGPSGDDVAARINTPSETYFNSLLGAAPYDWLYQTVAQPNAGNRNMAQPRGRLLGGSSAINGMYMVRPSQVEIDAWSSLIASNDQAAADVWKWDNFFGYLKESEKFTPPTSDAQTAAGMKYDQSSHGTSGKVHTTYPAYMVPVSGAWLPALEAAGVASNPDADSGVNVGGQFALTALNPSNWTRSYSKSAYIDVLPPRDNLHIITGATVERLTFSDQSVDGNRVANAVQFSTGPGTPVLSVNVTKEAILSGGAYGSPHVLLLSGVGPKDVLDGANVTVQNELPGVGQHLQDHLSVGVYFNAKTDTQGSIHASGSSFSKTPEFNSFVNSGVAYINGSRLFNGDDNFATFQASITSAAASSAASLVPSQYSPVVEGYKAIYKATSENIYPTAGLIEILLSLNSPGQIAIQAALQQPLSHGRVYITSPSVYDNPAIDPQYFSHSADITLLRQGIRLARTIASQSPLSDSLGDEVTPGPSVASDADIEAWLRKTAGTEFHPTGACAMLPKEQGGVVDGKLKVYGLSNVRVVDSSIFPVSWSAHMMAATYALAEKAGSIILADASTPTNTSSSGTKSNSPSATGASSSSSSTAKSSAATTQVSASWFALLFPLVAALLL